MLAPTLWFVPAFLLLIGLGTWQIQRLHWKLGLIAEMNANMVAAPLSLPDALALGPRAQYHVVMLKGRFLDNREVRLRSRQCRSGRRSLMPPMRRWHCRQPA